MLTALGIHSDPLIDTLLTGVVLVGGPDRITGLLKAPGAEPQKEEPQPIEITGKLILEESAAIRRIELLLKNAA